MLATVSAESTTELGVQTLDRVGFRALAGEWPALQTRSRHRAPFFSHGFLTCWLEAFGGELAPQVIAVRDAHGLRAALPLVPREETRLGVKVHKLTGAANVHSGRFDLIADPADDAAIRAIWQHLKDDPTWDLIELPDVPVGEAASAAAPRLLDLARQGGFLVGTWDSMQTPFIPLGDEPLLRRVGAKFRSNLRRRRRLMSEIGEVHLERTDSGPLVEERLEEGLGLEASGWKGREGTAIECQAETRRFYRSLARMAGDQGSLALYTLFAGARPVAFHFGLAWEGVYYLPKMGFDEAHAQCSPGQLILEEVASDLEQRGYRELDFLGPNMPWKQEWTQQTRNHGWCYVYRNRPLGRMLHAAKFTVAPRVKEVLPWKR